MGIRILSVEMEVVGESVKIPIPKMAQGKKVKISIELTPTVLQGLKDELITAMYQAKEPSDRERMVRYILHDHFGI